MIELETMSILVVDDMKSMRLTIRKMLRSLNIGKMLRFAENGRAGLDILAATPCDIAIIDWNMPVMNGSQMLNRLRQDKVLRDIPVIMVTAENERDIVAEVAEHEIDAYLLKPLTLRSLEIKIKTVVEQANNPDACTRHILSARQLEEAGDLQGAIDQIRQALVHKPSASRILRKMGLLHLELGKHNIGIKCLQKAISVNRQDTMSRHHLARIFIQKKEYRKASRIYMEILELSKRYFGSATRLGETMIAAGYRPEAVQLFSRVLAKAKRRSDLKERICNICLENQETSFALNIMENTLKDNPSNFDLMFRAARVHLQNGNAEKAMSYFRTIDSGKKGDPASKLEIARIHQRNGKILQADDYVRQVLRIDPGNEEALALRRQL